MIWLLGSGRLGSVLLRHVCNESVRDWDFCRLLWRRLSRWELRWWRPLVVSPRFMRACSNLVVRRLATFILRVFRRVGKDEYLSVHTGKFLFYYTLLAQGQGWRSSPAPIWGMARVRTPRVVQRLASCRTAGMNSSSLGRQFADLGLVTM